MCIFWGWKDRYTLHVNGSKQCGPGGLWLCKEMGHDRVKVYEVLKPDICDDSSLRHGDLRYNTLIPKCRYLALFRRMQMGWVQRNHERGPGLKLEIFKYVHSPIESAHSPFGTQREEECSGVNAVPLVFVLQTCSSRMFVFKGKVSPNNNVDWVSRKQFYKPNSKSLSRFG